MQVIQMLPTIAYGDAVSNDARAIENVLREMGYKTEIYAESVDVRFPKGVAKSVKKLPKLKADDVVLFHMSTGDQLNWDFGKLNCKKVMIYHNITPPEFLSPYNDRAALVCEEGLRALRWLADKVDYCLAVSEFNKKDLTDFNYQCKIDVLPIVIPFEDYAKEPNPVLMRQLEKDHYTNILFTGRIAPNKCQQDVIRAFAEYKKNYNQKARLILIGSSNGYENYRRRLESYINALGVDDVVMSGHIKFDEILAYYRNADLFLCQSEHEGFCVPLVEAMYFEVPIVAYDSTAIYDTLGGSGICLDQKNPFETAGVMNKVLTDEKLRSTIVSNQRERLKDFDNAAVKEHFKQLMLENVLK